MCHQTVWFPQAANHRWRAQRQTRRWQVMPLCIVDAALQLETTLDSGYHQKFVCHVVLLAHCCMMRCALMSHQRHARPLRRSGCSGRGFRRLRLYLYVLCANDRVLIMPACLPACCNIEHCVTCVSTLQIERRQHVCCSVACLPQKACRPFKNQPRPYC